ncbi:hypothetical protein BDP55DRAFT_672482 [Colletotrichum godetiae]|uniref:Uncharacterized protein n=1 Tax=Colletotrichum godetiae TaxID=1209918 RepID=A0AAJ0AF46_9PEZI|nr:uncharacterized protein BDP55DRAFT_672482 [Colletotrichum godetiae]KAK1672753.1 hypothetical protein BDP55DRAFT_672482 [Colletotrichum godetiae]
MVQPTLSLPTFLAANSIVEATVAVTHIRVFLIPVGLSLAVALPVPKKSTRSSVFRTKQVGLLYSKEMVQKPTKTRCKWYRPCRHYESIC